MKEKTVESQIDARTEFDFERMTKKINVFEESRDFSTPGRRTPIECIIEGMVISNNHFEER
jgi:hypothetical protein